MIAPTDGEIWATCPPILSAFELRLLDFELALNEFDWRLTCHIAGIEMLRRHVATMRAAIGAEKAL